MHEAGTQPLKIRDTISSLHDVDIDIKDVTNTVKKLTKSKDGLSDSAQFLDALYGMRDEEEGYLSVQHDSEARLKNVFWANQEMLHAART